MSFQFKRDEAVTDGVRRIASHQLEAVIRGLAGHPRTGRAKAIHETRKRLKRLRALMRLTRNAMGRKTFHRENRAYRDAARPLSAARDAHVLVATLDALVQHFQSDLADNAFRPIRSRLAARARALNTKANQPNIPAILRALREAKSRTKDWEYDDEGWDALCTGLHRTYRDGRRAMNDALDRPDDDLLHTWRKRVKDLRHQVELLESAWPEQNEKLADELRQLSDLLGDDHDLAVLRTTLKDSPDHFGGKAALTPLIGLIDSRRDELQRQAGPLGRRLYAEKPADFINRMHSYWHAWREGR